MPILKIPIAQQLPTASSLGSKNILPGSVLHLPLGWSFSVGLQGDTFTLPDGGSVFMSASVNGNTQLPSWMTWSADSFTLYGVAPTLPGPEGLELNVVLTGSNRPEFGGTTDSLKILISPHALSLDGTLRAVNASVGNKFTYQIPTTALELDGRQNNATSNAISIAADLALYSWLEFDNSTATLSGTPPFEQFKDANVTQVQVVPLVFSDSYNNHLTANLSINVEPFGFTMPTLPNVFVEPGKQVNVSLARYIRTSSLPQSYAVVQNLAAVDEGSRGSTVNVTYEPATASSWLHFDPEALLLTGTFPPEGQNRVKVNVLSTNADNQTSSAFFYLAAKGDGLSGTGNNAANSNGGGGLSHRAKVALAGALGGVAGLLCLIALMICCRRYVAKEEHDRHGVMRDDDDHTLTDTSSRRRFKKAIVVRKGGETMTPSTLAASPYMDKEKQLDRSPVTLRGVVVEDPQGGRRDVTHEADEPKQSRMITNLFNGQRGSAAKNAGLGLALGMEQQPMEGAQRSGNQGRMQHSRSRESVRSHRSSWESDLFYDDEDDRQAKSNSLGVQDPANDMPRRRGGGGRGTAATMTSLNVRHRNTHVNESPAFHASGVFTPPGQAARSTRNVAVEDEDEDGLSETFEDSRTGLTPGAGPEEAEIMEAKVMQVRRHSPLMQRNNNPFSQTMGRSADKGEDSQTGAFDDAEDENAMEALMLTGGAVARRREPTAKNRTSTLSTMTDNSQMRAIRAHYASEAAVPDVFSPNPSFMDGASLSGYEPQETVRAVEPRPKTPPPRSQPAATSHTRHRSGGSVSSRHMPCPNVPAMVNYPVRFHIFPNVPPPMAGAPGSPGKRSGEALRYSLVVDDSRAHLSAYRLTWPDMLADWLSFDEATFEAFGIVPERAGLEELGDVEIALVSTKKAARVPPSPQMGSPSKRRSVESAHAAFADDEVSVVARARLVFQHAPPPRAF